MTGIRRLERTRASAVTLISLAVLGCAAGMRPAPAVPAPSGPAPASAALASAATAPPAAPVPDSATVARQRWLDDSIEAFVLLRRGVGNMQGGRDSDAASDFTAALRLDPRLTEALRDLGMLQFRARRLPLALALADSASALGDTSAPLVNLRGRILASMQRCPEAVAVLAPFLKAHPEWRQPAPDLAFCLLSLRRATEAVAVMQVAVRQEPSATPLRYALVESFVMTRQFDSALVHASYLREHEPGDALWWVLTGRVLWLLNRLDEARDNFERGFRLRPGLVDSLPPMDHAAWQAVQGLKRRTPR